MRSHLIVTLLVLGAAPRGALGEEPKTATSTQAQAAVEVAKDGVPKDGAEKDGASKEGVAKDSIRKDGAEDGAKDEAATTLSGGTPTTSRPYYFRGTLQLRQIAVTDLRTTVGNREISISDVDAERSMIWALEVGYKVLPDLAVFARGGLLERFVVEQGEGDFRLRDTAIGARCSWELPLEAIGLGDRKLHLMHGLAVFLPTSLVSQEQDLRFAPELTTRLRLPIIENLYVVADGSFQYRNHAYAERAGTHGGENTLFTLGAGFGLGYSLSAGDLGLFDFGGGVRSDWFRRYDSNETYVSATSDQGFWNQIYGWDLYVYYAPMAELGFSIAFSQGAPLLRDGIVRIAPLREDSELAFTLVASY